MRMRKRHNLAPRMEKCAAVMIDEPEKLKGTWKEHFGFEKVHVELGCGKGRFTADTAMTMPDTLLVAIEKIPDAMIIAMERVRDREIGNVCFMDRDAVKLREIFSDGEADRIYINFCDPWPKSRDAKFRLTAPGFLRLYADVLPMDGEIWFKTDNTPLFNWSIEQFKAEGWELTELTFDLHEHGPVGIMTDYEAKFYRDGLKINRLVATKSELTKTTAAGAVPRIHNAALSDARGYADSKQDNAEKETPV